MATKKENTVTPLVLANSETGKTVTIEFNRNIILRMEREGLASDKVAEAVTNAPLSAISDLFYYGCLMHQPNTTREEAENLLFDGVGVSAELVERLAGLYQKPYMDMVSAQRKNSLWTVK